MRELDNILNAYQILSSEEKSMALATVIRVEGSSYRRPGAKMLIADDGTWHGCISGGCLEGDALRRARQVMSTGESVVVTYDTMDDENNTLGIGLGCNGIIDVFIEPVTNATLNPVSAYQPLQDAEEPIIIGTVIQSNHPDMPVGTRFGETQPSTGPDWLLDSIWQYEKEPNLHVLELQNGTATVFIERIDPPIHLFIFGGGFDARPVADLAKQMGWRVTVTDECVAHVAPVHFPTADKVLQCHREYIHKEIEFPGRAAAVVMSHALEYDKKAVEHLIQSDVPYIGILGPRSRATKIFDYMSEVGIKLSPHDLERIHSPVGLDIGAETPQEIALAIVAEIRARFGEREGGPLKYRGGPIHRHQSTSNTEKDNA